MILTQTMYEHPVNGLPDFVCYVFECIRPVHEWNLKVLKLLGWKTMCFHGQSTSLIIMYRRQKKGTDMMTLYYLHNQAHLLCKPGDKIAISKTYIGGKLTQTMIQEDENRRPIFGIDENREGYAAY
jgi:hypothetical protein